MRRRSRWTPRLAVLLAPLLLVTTAHAGFETLDVGTAGAQFLALGAGARAEGMGEAYGAVVDDAEAIYWNPAALARIQDHSLSLMHETLPASVNYEFVGYGQTLGRWGGMGASLQYLSQPAIGQTDSSGFSTGSSFHPSDMAVSLGYAYTLQSDNWGVFTGASFGAVGKYVSSTITRTASTYGGDIGFLSAPFKVYDGDFRIAYVAQNLGGTLKFQQIGDPLPTNLKFATSWEPTKSWLLAADFNEPVAAQPYLSIGSEYRVQFDGGSFAARAGFNSRILGQAGSLSGLSFGLGAKFKGVGLDYAFASLGALGMTNYFSLTFSF